MRHEAIAVAILCAFSTARAHLISVGEMVEPLSAQISVRAFGESPGDVHINHPAAGTP